MQQLVRFLFRFTLILWGTAILTALIGHFTGVEVFDSLTLATLRYAPAVTAIWLAVALVRMGWMHLWSGPPPWRRKRGAAPTNRLP